MSKIFFFKNPLKLIIWAVLSISSIVLLIIAVKRDIIYKRDYNSDLRNRIVGARLVQDGKSPYYYKWKEADGIRYYDPGVIPGDSKVSNITTSPFFLHLLMPVCNIQEYTVAEIWLFFEYIMFGIIWLIAFSFCKNPFTKIAVCIIAMAFLFTDAWKYHVSNGQMYIVVPFFLSLFIYLLSKAKTKFLYFLCGITAISLILLRPNFIVFFAPFLLLFKKTAFKYVVAFFVPAIIAFAIIFSNSFERRLWTDFFEAIKEHSHIHQGEVYAKAPPVTAIKYTVWEGIIDKDINFLTPEMAITPKTENGNFFVVFKLLTRQKINSSALLILCSIILAGLFLWLLTVLKKVNYSYTDIRVLTIFGFCLYMITDIFSPIHRHQYNTLQWVFVTLLFFSIPSKKNWLLVLVTTGVFLNMINVDFLKMEHTIGEYLILLALLIFSFSFFNRQQLEN